MMERQSKAPPNCPERVARARSQHPALSPRWGRFLRRHSPEQPFGSSQTHQVFSPRLWSWETPGEPGRQAVALPRVHHQEREHTTQHECPPLASRAPTHRNSQLIHGAHLHFHHSHGQELREGFPSKPRSSSTTGSVAFSSARCFVDAPGAEHGRAMEGF